VALGSPWTWGMLMWCVDGRFGRENDRASGSRPGTGEAEQLLLLPPTNPLPNEPFSGVQNGTGEWPGKSELLLPPWLAAAVNCCAVNCCADGDADVDDDDTAPMFKKLSEIAG
jgi:hypothetical protein